jgi:hypothetical protein
LNLVVIEIPVSQLSGGSSTPDTLIISGSDAGFLLDDAGSGPLSDAGVSFVQVPQAPHRHGVYSPGHSPMVTSSYQGPCPNGRFTLALCGYGGEGLH